MIPVGSARSPVRPSAVICPTIRRRITTTTTTISRPILRSAGRPSPFCPSPWFEQNVHDHLHDIRPALATMLKDNPSRVQYQPATVRTRTNPLVLIHDGGGTTFAYFTLDSLNRDVWAIHNPRFETSQPWEGGMDEMARHYIRLIEDTRISGSILLGGWSLGGYLSLAMARMLRDAPSNRFSVVGLVLIDSPYHVPWSTLPPDTADLVIGDVPPLVQKSFDLCDDMLEFWELPAWDGPAGAGRTVHLTADGQEFAINSGQVLYKPVAEGYRVRESPGSPPATPARQLILPPPGILIRCTTPTPRKDPSDDSSVVDMHRADPMLGWAATHPAFIKAVFDTDAHHFNIFDFAKTTAVSAQLNQGLSMLDSLLMPDMF
nr:orsellinic acid synthase [Quercus suber]